MEQDTDVHFEELASMFSTWSFLSIYGLFNIAVLLSVILKYGVLISSLSFESSYYTLLLSLVSIVVTTFIRASFPSSANSSLF